MRKWFEGLLQNRWMKWLVIAMKWVATVIMLLLAILWTALALHRLGPLMAIPNGIVAGLLFVHGLTFLHESFNKRLYGYIYNDKPWSPTKTVVVDMFFAVWSLFPAAAFFITLALWLLYALITFIPRRLTGWPPEWDPFKGL